MMTREQVLIAFSTGKNPDKEKYYLEFDETVNNPATSQEDREQLFAWYDEAVNPPAVLSEDILDVDEPKLQQVKQAALRAPVEAVDSSTAKNRLRAMRGNMLKKLKKHYPPYTLFSAEQAATKTKTNIYDMTTYLVKEARLPGAQVRYDESENKFFLMTMF